MSKNHNFTVASDVMKNRTESRIVV